MVAHLSPKQNNAWVEDEGQVQDNIRQDRSSLLEEFLSLGISCNRKIENISCAVHLGERPRSLVTPPPAFQDSGCAQCLVKLSIFVDGGMFSGNIGHTEITNFSG